VNQAAPSWKLLLLLASIETIVVGCRSRGELFPQAIQTAPTVADSMTPPAPDRDPIRDVDLANELARLPNIDNSRLVTTSKVAEPSPGTPVETAANLPNRSGAIPVSHTVETKTADVADAVLVAPRIETVPARSVHEAESIEAPPARIVIAGVRPGEGNVRVAIFTSDRAFPQPDAASQVLSMKSAGKQLELSVQVESPFAVAVYQDINNDGELSRNRIGIPVEPFAFSNNAQGRMGPPAFDDAKIELPTAADTPQIISIHLP
jgi:uncharacterized protein (DUF2141 family)